MPPGILVSRPCVVPPWRTNSDTLQDQSVVSLQAILADRSTLVFHLWDSRTPAQPQEYFLTANKGCSGIAECLVAQGQWVGNPCGATSPFMPAALDIAAAEVLIAEGQPVVMEVTCVFVLSHGNDDTCCCCCCAVCRITINVGHGKLPETGALAADNAGSASTTRIAAVQLRCTSALAPISPSHPGTGTSPSCTQSQLLLSTCCYKAEKVAQRSVGQLYQSHQQRRKREKTLLVAVTAHSPFITFLEWTTPEGSATGSSAAWALRTAGCLPLRTHPDVTLAYRGVTHTIEDVTWCVESPWDCGEDPRPFLAAISWTSAFPGDPPAQEFSLLTLERGTPQRLPADTEVYAGVTHLHEGDGAGFVEGPWGLQNTMLALQRCLVLPFSLSKTGMKGVNTTGGPLVAFFTCDFSHKSTTGPSFTSLVVFNEVGCVGRCPLPEGQLLDAALVSHPGAIRTADMVALMRNSSNQSNFLVHMHLSLEDDATAPVGSRVMIEMVCAEDISTDGSAGLTNPRAASTVVLPSLLHAVGGNGQRDVHVGLYTLEHKCEVPKTCVTDPPVLQGYVDILRLSHGSSKGLPSLKRRIALQGTGTLCRQTLLSERGVVSSCSLCERGKGWAALLSSGQLISCEGEHQPLRYHGVVHTASPDCPNAARVVEAILRRATPFPPVMAWMALRDRDEAAALLGAPFTAGATHLGVTIAQGVTACHLMGFLAKPMDVSAQMLFAATSASSSTAAALHARHDPVSSVVALGAMCHLPCGKATPAAASPTTPVGGVFAFLIGGWRAPRGELNKHGAPPQQRPFALSLLTVKVTPYVPQLYFANEAATAPASGSTAVDAEHTATHPIPPPIVSCAVAAAMDVTTSDLATENGSGPGGRESLTLRLSRPLACVGGPDQGSWTCVVDLVGASGQAMEHLCVTASAVEGGDSFSFSLRLQEE